MCSCRSRILNASALALAFLLAPAAGAPAEELVPGKLYGGGTRLEVSEAGAAFTVPRGWRGTWPPETEAFVLQPESDPNTVIAALADAWSRAQVVAMMGQPIDLGDGVVLVPTSAVGERGSALTGRYRVNGAPQVAYVEALAGAHGISVAYVLISAPASLAGFEPAVRQLIDGTTLAAPAGGQEPPRVAQGGGSGSAGSGANDRWDTYLKGKHIVRFFTATGYTEETHLWLCSDGSFRRSGSGGGFGGGASGAYQGGGTGRWTASGAGEHGVLNLRFGDGSTLAHELRWDYQENALYVDGKKWLHDKNEVCN